MLGQERGSGGPFLASQDTDFFHLTANISKTIVTALHVN